ncbi:hypothetical protein [Sphingobacterium pedocola]|uniref:Uncharacterized protein n=1 Tax=Sphingobacterium pedocola TaxID=2082722 RepID=A0ABR9T892_9SPHI|nr:hypothetical protein [Sphingobacterium pedocola]MBE8721563.1 hypothetical protein [Sphingobacterium pedocola]
MMNPYFILYYHLYKHSEYLKRNVAGSFFASPPGDGIIFLSAFEVLNVSTLGIHFSWPAVTASHMLDAVLLGGVFMGINYVIFIRTKKYLKISENMAKESPEKKFITGCLVLFYVLLSIVLFSVVYW